MVAGLLGTKSVLILHKDFSYFVRDIATENTVNKVKFFFILIIILGSGGVTSGRGMAFCWGRFLDYK